MAAIDDIIVWANTLPAWQANAVRRLLSAGEQPLSTQDEQELVALARADLSLAAAPTQINPIPSVRGVFSSTPASAVSVRLLSINDVQHVNLIEAGNSLPFAETGVTVVYGNNGTGKSGYARILKLACSARDKDERILPNVFSTTVGNSSATLKLKQDGNNKSIVWTQGQTTDPILTNVNVFDARCARLITDERSEITYLPYGADVFEKLVALITRVKATIEKEIVNLEPLQDSGVLANTPSALFLQSLSEKTPDIEINGATAWTSDDDSCLVAKEELLRQSGTAQATIEIAKLDKVKSRINTANSAVKELLSTCGPLSDDVCEKALTELHAAVKAHETALAERKTEELLPGVASTNQWKILYEAAKQYSEQVAYRSQTFPNTADDALCVLCQQPIASDAIVRFQRFKKFMEDATVSVLRAQRQAVQTLCDRFGALTPWSGGALDSLCDELTQFDPNAANSLRAFHGSIVSRRAAALEALNKDEKSGKALSLTSVADSPETALQSVVQLITQKIADITTAAKPDEFRRLQTEIALLKSKKALSARKTDIVTHVMKARRNATVRRAVATLRTTEITKQGTALIQKNLTPELLRLFNAEITALGATRVPISMRPTGSTGETLHELQLEGARPPPRTRISQILSEGEARVIAIAGFLAELQLTQQSNPIVFDDPVSSLDHVFTHKIASRLANEGLKRQVIIFTHNIAFLMELKDSADALAKRGTPVAIKVQTLRRNGSAAGITTDDAPWHAMKVNQRADYLEQLISKMVPPNNDTEKYNDQGARIYGLLREAWEACVEDDLLHAIVCRYRNSVQTLKLDEVSIEDSDIHLIDLNMSKCSAWMTGHDKSKALHENRPEPQEILVDIQALRDFSRQIRRRWGDTKKRRRAQLES